MRSRFTMLVHDFFRFADGSTVFLGTVEPELPILVPATAEVFVAGRSIGHIHLAEERMPGPASGGRRSLVTRDPIDHDNLRMGVCTLICET